MSAPNTPALRTLAAFLRTVPRKKFNYCSWAGPEYNGAATAVDCGTTACAFGWATAIPEFRAQGLCLKGTPGPYNDAFVCLVDDDGPTSSNFSANWGLSVAAGAKVFGLNERQFEWLFTPSDDFEAADDEDWGDDGKPTERAGPATVADHIEAFCDAVEAGDIDCYGVPNE